MYQANRALSFVRLFMACKMSIEQPLLVVTLIAKFAGVGAFLLMSLLHVMAKSKFTSEFFTANGALQTFLTSALVLA